MPLILYAAPRSSHFIVVPSLCACLVCAFASRSFRRECGPLHIGIATHNITIHNMNHYELYVPLCVVYGIHYFCS